LIKQGPKHQTNNYLSAFQSGLKTPYVSFRLKDVKCEKGVESNIKGGQIRFLSKFLVFDPVINDGCTWNVHPRSEFMCHISVTHNTWSNIS